MAQLNEVSAAKQATIPLKHVRCKQISQIVKTTICK